ncbi:cupin domain-containing protein [Frankia sp. AgB32]|nr:cupin domain-containing protein [Frankia sp. AgB32]MCK9895778.1 cupin domain-containing protein [Frankia sp. AgB32]
MTARFRPDENPSDHVATVQVTETRVPDPQLPVDGEQDFATWPASPAPIDLAAALNRFEELWSPRIAARVNDYDVRLAKVRGEHVWHSHADTDEFFLVLAGALHIALRDGPAGRERVVVLDQGQIFVVPRGVEHRPASPAGASILLFEPSGTLTVGDRHDAVPDHVDVTTGHPLR